MEEWRRLKLKVLRQRIQRLVVLMDLSEPGTIPDSGMLASLIDLVNSHIHMYIIMAVYTWRYVIDLHTHTHTHIIHT